MRLGYERYVAPRDSIWPPQNRQRVLICSEPERRFWPRVLARQNLIASKPSGRVIRSGCTILDGGFVSAGLRARRGPVCAQCSSVRSLRLPFWLYVFYRNIGKEGNILFWIKTFVIALVSSSTHGMHKSIEIDWPATSRVTVILKASVVCVHFECAWCYPGSTSFV